MSGLLLLRRPSACRNLLSIHNKFANCDRTLDSEIDHRDREYEASRREQAWLHAELQSRKKAHRDARIKATQEVEESKELKTYERMI